MMEWPYDNIDLSESNIKHKLNNTDFIAYLKSHKSPTERKYAVVFKSET
jgi:hypothetical protein